MSEPRFKEGVVVTLRNEPQTSGAITDLELREDGRYYYRIFLESSREPWISENDLVNRKVGSDPLRRAEQDLWGSPEAFLTFLTLKKLRYPLTDLLYSYQASRTDLLPHQFIPLLKVLDSPNQRILIADEVGLGKTIEAGLIMAEQKSRGQLKRVLIVCQGALLMRKWVAEMRHRFDEPFELLTSERLESFLQDYEQGRDPELRAVASLPFLRRPEWLKRLEELRVHFDMTVVDEAHRLKNRHSVSYQLGEVLAQHSDMLLFLTATPLHLGNEDLFSLLHLLDPERFPSMAHLNSLLRPQEILNQCVALLRHPKTPMDELLTEFHQLTQLRDATWLRDDPVLQRVESRLLKESLTSEERIDLQRLLLSLSPFAHVFTRTRRVDIDLRFAERTPVRVVVQLGTEEQQFMDDVEALAEAVFQASGSPFGAGLASITLRRQAASSLPATLIYLRDVLSSVFSVEELEEDLPDLELPDKRATSFQLDPIFHPQVRELMRRYSSVARSDTKFDEFLTHLRQQIGEGQRKFIVFSFFKRTLAYLDSRLREVGLSTHLLTGDVPPDDREAVVEDFRLEEQPCLLLSSEVGGEGLDFQFASVMFNYDMPWNPMVVEQRIGRIDRIGQQSERVIIFNFSVVGTIEERIFEKLYTRIKLFRRSIGDLEAILGEQLGRLTQDILKYKLTPDEEARRADKLADAIVRQGRVLGELEKEHARISGDDSYFLQRVGEVRTGKRFLQPEELERFVRTAMEMLCARSRLVTVPRRPGVLRVQDTQGLWSVLGARSARSRESKQLLQKLTTLFHHPELTFRSAVAQGDRGLTLVTPRHPLVELLKNEPILDEEAHDRLTPTGAFLCPGLPQRDYLVFFFLLSYEGFRRSLLLSAMPVLLPDMAVQAELEEIVLAGLSNPKLKEWDRPDHIGARVSEARQAATSAVVMQKRMREAELEVEAARLVSMRHNSLCITFEKRRQLLRQKIDVPSHEKILRMHVAALERLERIYEQDLTDLEERKKVYCQEELVGVAYCRGLGEA